MRQLRRTPGRLAGDRDDRCPLGVVAVHEVHDQARHEQQDAEHRAAQRVVLADDREVHPAREDLEVAAEHDRVAEVGEGLHEQEEEARCEAGEQERQHHRPERVPAGGAQVRRRLVERRIQRPHEAGQADVGDREEREAHHQDHALEAVDVEVEPEQVARDDPRAAEEHDRRQRQRERRAHDREQRHDVHEPLEEPRKRHAHLHVGEQEADEGADRRHGDAEDHRVEHDLALGTDRVALEDGQRVGGQAGADHRQDRHQDRHDHEEHRDRERDRQRRVDRRTPPTRRRRLCLGGVRGHETREAGILPAPRPLVTTPITRPGPPPPRPRSAGSETRAPRRRPGSRTRSG